MQPFVSRLRTGTLFLFAYCAPVFSVLACTVCDSETGRLVREGVFGDDFGKNVLLTLAPFPVVFGMISLFCKAVRDKSIDKK